MAIGLYGQQHPLIELLVVDLVESVRGEQARNRDVALLHGDLALLNRHLTLLLGHLALLLGHGLRRRPSVRFAEGLVSLAPGHHSERRRDDEPDRHGGQDVALAAPRLALQLQGFQLPSRLLLPGGRDELDLERGGGRVVGGRFDELLLGILKRGAADEIAGVTPILVPAQRLDLKAGVVLDPFPVGVDGDAQLRQGVLELGQLRESDLLILCLLRRRPGIYLNPKDLVALEDDPVELGQVRREPADLFGRQPIDQDWNDALVVL